jgi:hypothetical protein
MHISGQPNLIPTILTLKPDFSCCDLAQVMEGRPRPRLPSPPTCTQVPTGHLVLNGEVPRSNHQRMARHNNNLMEAERTGFPDFPT